MDMSEIPYIVGYSVNHGAGQPEMLRKRQNRRFTPREGHKKRGHRKTCPLIAKSKPVDGGVRPVDP
jgi:hypothetical protein